MTEILHFIKWCARKILTKLYSGFPSWLHMMHRKFVWHLRHEVMFAIFLWALGSALSILIVAVCTIVFSRSDAEIRQLMPVTMWYTFLTSISYMAISIVNAAYNEFQQEREDLLADLRRGHDVRR